MQSQSSIPLALLFVLFGCSPGDVDFEDTSTAAIIMEAQEALLEKGALSSRLARVERHTRIQEDLDAIRSVEEQISIVPDRLPHAISPGGEARLWVERDDELKQCRAMVEDLATGEVRVLVTREFGDRVVGTDTWGSMGWSSFFIGPGGFAITDMSLEECGTYLWRTTDWSPVDLRFSKQTEEQNPEAAKRSFLFRRRDRDGLPPLEGPPATFIREEEREEGSVVLVRLASVVSAEVLNAWASFFAVPSPGRAMGYARRVEFYSGLANQEHHPWATAMVLLTGNLVRVGQKDAGWPYRLSGSIRTSPDARFLAVFDYGPKFGGTIGLVDLAEETYTVVSGCESTRLHGELQAFCGTNWSPKLSVGSLSVGVSTPFAFTPDGRRLVIKTPGPQYGIYDLERHELRTRSFAGPADERVSPFDELVALQAGLGSAESFRQLLSGLREAVENEEVEAVSRYLAYPVSVKLKASGGEKEFVLYHLGDLQRFFGRIFTPRFRSEFSSGVGNWLQGTAKGGQVVHRKGVRIGGLWINQRGEVSYLFG